MVNPKTILVVDDDSTLRGGLQVVLQQNGYRTLEADDGLAAENLIHKHRPDLVILDMMMPRWGGFAVLERFQNNPAAPAFIMLTGNESDKHRAYATQIGVVDYLQKPCSMEQLLQRIDRHFHPPVHTSGSKSAGSGTPTMTGRILLVDIHKPLLRALRSGLEDNGFTVEETEASADLAERAAAFDVVVLDVMDSKADGLAMVQKWRRDGIATEILVLTGKGDFDETVRGLDAGADDCLSRPFQLEELLARSRALARRRRRVEDPIVRVHDLEIDTAERTVKRGGRPIYLTPREFDLLHLLVSHRGEVVTRAMIWDHLYDNESRHTSNVVDVYVRYLRTKLDSDFDKKLILTRWGEGYVFCGDE